ncbi:MAG: hypothetical protein EPO22_07395 [Dehalococcoidia bacterium]|nr:MAG: hypothetical protein EPO22_07395 [Dehalococcoidia bacterium]
MKFAAAAGLAGLAAAAIVVVVAVFAESRSGGVLAVQIEPYTPSPVPATATPAPPSWLAGLAHGGGASTLIACLDANQDGRLDGNDSPELDGLDVELQGGACGDVAHTSDYFVGAPSDASAFECDGGRPPLLIVAVPGALTNLLDTRGTESLGLVDIVNVIDDRAAAAGIATQVILAPSAVDGGVPAQTSMERWLAHDLARRLDETPCLRAVVIGHSHGAVTVTSVAAALDDSYADRLLGVLLDRTTVLYDHNATEVPARTRILNYYQLNEGWHGVALGQPNVVDVDVSSARAYIAASDGGGGLALVSHKTLDDAAEVQLSIEDAVMAWLARGS